MVAATVGVLVATSAGAVRTFETLHARRLDAQYRSNLAQFGCLVGQVHRLIPKGATVAVGGGYDGQVLGELLLRWADPTYGPHPQWVLTLDHRGSCAGEQVEAYRA